jgi:Siphovirus Gp157
MSTALAPLYHIEEHLIALLDTIDATPDEMRLEIQAEIDAYLGKEAAKVDQIAHVLAALEWEQKAAADEIARLTERKKAAAASAERLEQYVCRVLKMRGGKKLAGVTSSLSVRPSDAVKITDADLIPARYQTAEIKMPLWLWQYTVEGVDEDSEFGRDLRGVKVNSNPSVSTIKAAIKAGEDVPGADIVYRDNLVRK